MARVVAGITTSIDGYISGPNDRPGKGLGEGGERLHSWVFGGAWTYADQRRGEPTGEDAAFLAEAMATLGVILGGGKRLFEGFTQSIDLEPLGVRQSPFATFITYRVKQPR